MLERADENQQVKPGPRHLRIGSDRIRAAVSALPARQLLPKLVVAAAVITVAAIGLSTPHTQGTTPAADVAVASSPERSATGPASRSHKRTTPPDPAASAPATSAPATSAPAPAPTRPAPIGGLSQAEMDNAAAIVAVAKENNLPKRAALVALSTALQESHLRNLANGNLPASLNHPNQGVGYDYDSVGLFQQRPNWGNVDQLMNPRESARRFYAALLSIPGWGDYAVTVAAQMVQRSAFPDAYAKWEPLAQQLADNLM